MKCAIPLVLISALLPSTLGLVLPPRDLQSALNVFHSVQSSIDNLDTALRGWKTPADLSSVLNASNKLIQGLSAGRDAISAGKPLSLAETVKMIKPVQDLEKHARTLVNHLEGDKAKVRSEGLCAIVAQQVSAIDANGQGLTRATIDKVPDSAQSVATKVSQGILDVLAEAKKEFPGKSC